MYYLVDGLQHRNSVDLAFLALAVPERMKIQTPEVSERLTRALDGAVLLLGDTQLVTSVAILLSGYIQLPCGFSTQHWEVAVDLAWFSALTHLAALTSLRRYFRQRPTMAIWRVACRGITLLVLAAAIQPTGYVPQYLYDDSNLERNATADPRRLLSLPAICLMNADRRAEVARTMYIAGSGLLYWDNTSAQFNVGLVLFSLLYLVTSYVSRVIRLFEPAADAANRWLRFAPINYMVKTYEMRCRHSFGNRFVSRLGTGCWLICIMLFEAICEIGNSMLWEILWLTAALVWGTLRLIQHRNSSVLTDEDTWGFGQVLAVILSALPLWSFLSSFYETNHAPATSNTNSTDMSLIQGLGRLDDHSWYNGLASFMFGSAKNFVGSTIYILNMPASKDELRSDSLYLKSGQILLVFVFAFCINIFLSAAFASIAIAFHFKRIKFPKLPGWKAASMRWSATTKRRARTYVWVIFILSLLTCQLAIHIWIVPKISLAL